MLLSEQFGIKKKQVVVEDWTDFEYCRIKILQNTKNFDKVENPSEEIICILLRQDGRRIKNFEIQTEKMCLAAIYNCPAALQYIKDPSEEVILNAVKHTTTVFEYVKNPSESLCIKVAKINGHVLRFIENQTEEICLAAVRQNGLAIQHVKNQTKEICLEAVRQNGAALAHVKNKNQDLDIIRTAILGHAGAIAHINQTIPLIKYALIKNPAAAINVIDTNVLPIKDWDVTWFQYLHNPELRRAFIKERGKEVFNQLDCLLCIEEDNEYMLIEFKYVPQADNLQKALVYRCPSSNDIYFTEVDSKVDTIASGLRFLNNDIEKEQLAYES